MIKIVNIRSGLGNQMFQYAFYRALKKKYKKTYCNINFFKTNRAHNGFELEKIFKKITIEKNLLSSALLSKHIGGILRRILKTLGEFQVYWVEDTDYKRDLKNVDNNIFLTIYEGYWQSEKYFKDIEMEIREVFTFPELDDKNLEVAKKISDCESIAIHVRRGDYKDYPALCGVVDKQYYQRAIIEIEKRISNPTYFIFSDDIEWCKENLDLEEKNAVFINHNRGENSYRDMQLMSLCKHNIIPNSTFSWWGAWLNKNQNKIVIAPKEWFTEESNLEYKDIVPNFWIKTL